MLWQRCSCARSSSQISKHVGKRGSKTRAGVLCLAQLCWHASHAFGALTGARSSVRLTRARVGALSERATAVMTRESRERHTRWTDGQADATPESSGLRTRQARVSVGRLPAFQLVRERPQGRWTAPRSDVLRHRHREERPATAGTPGNGRLEPAGAGRRCDAGMAA